MRSKHAATDARPGVLLDVRFPVDPLLVLVLVARPLEEKDALSMRARYEALAAGAMPRGLGAFSRAPPALTSCSRRLPFVVVGAALCLYVLWALTVFDTRVFERGHSLVYDNPGTRRGWLAVPYVAATCGAMLFSGRLYLVALGIANLVGVLVSMLIETIAFTSIWCAYAAGVSALVYGYFRRTGAKTRASGRSENDG